MGTRREARERALELLYEAEIKGVDPVEVLDGQMVRPDDWTVAAVRGIAVQRDPLDRQLSGRLRADWDLNRIAVTEHLVLLMGLWELAAGDAPAAVVISECVELAKRYGSDTSSAFVNGVLAAVVRGG